MSQADSKPELLSPAGDWDCARAAVANGADAIYFGLGAGYNARARATNFNEEELPTLMAFLHRYGVRGYITLNTLIFTDELADLERRARRAIEAGVDAVLVQDLGAARLFRALSPDWPLHASTQMSLTSGECIRQAEQLGIARVVLPRELSIDEIAAIRRQTQIELEAFVHGALCVAYSGQCLTSESFGGRSANRGQCAQACRMPYQLICDGQERDLGPQEYLLSPQDLAAFDLLPQLLAAGISAVKIEGRLKTAEYVAAVTRHYRQALDTAAAGRPVKFTPREIEYLEMTFSRGFSHGWLEGCDHKTLVPGLSSANRGVLSGEVVEVRRGRVKVELRSGIKRGDGVVFEGRRAREKATPDAEQGGRVYEVFCRGRSVEEPIASGTVELTFGHGTIEFSRLYPGQKLWKTDDPELTRRLRRTYTTENRRRVPIDLEVEAAVDRPLKIVARTAAGATAQVESEEPLQPARKHPLSAELLREQLGRLGETAYELRDLQAQIEGGPMAPLSVLGKLRHAMVEQLDAAMQAPPPRSLPSESPLPALRVDTADRPATSEIGPQLHVLCRSLEQLTAVLACGVDSVLVDFQDIRQYRQAVAAARAAGAMIALATPRIQKPREMGIFHALAKHAPDAVLARNLAALAFFHEQGLTTIADFSLNATNELAVGWLLQHGAARVTASYDMNRDQLLALVGVAPAVALEVVVHQHIPMFHMEHCVFCAVLSPGRNKTDCGRPCDRHEVRLRDHVGAEHPLRADVGCRNTLFNGTPQSGAEIVPALLEQGVRHFRVELLDTGDRPEKIIPLYRDLLAGRITGRRVWEELQAVNRVGVTRGTLEARRDPLAIL